MSDLSVRVYYDADTDRGRLDGRTFAIIGYGSQGHAHALNLRESGARVIVGLRAGQQVRGAGQGRGARRAAGGGGGRRRRHDHDAGARPGRARASTSATSRPGWLPGKTLMFAHGFNIHYGEIVPPAGVDVDHGRAQVARPSGAERVRGGTRRAGAGRGASGRVGPGTGQRARLRGGYRLHPRRRDRDLVPRGDRDRSLRRAGRALRRGDRAGEGGLRDPHRGRLPARDGVLRVPPRAQADRGSDVPRRDAVHALLHQRHRGVRRLHPRAAHHHRGDPGRDAADPRRRSRTARSRGSGWTRTARAGPTSSGCGRRTAITRSSRSGQSCGR